MRGLWGVTVHLCPVLTSNCARTALAPWPNLLPPLCCVLQVRQRLARGVLAGLQTLASTRRLTDSLLGATCEFVHRSLHGGGGSGPEVDERLLAKVGRLPLPRLLQLYAFLALRLAEQVKAPRDLDPELQASEQ